MSEYHWATLERKRRILDLVRMIDEKNGMTLSEIMAVTGYHKNTILSYIKVMEKNGWVDVYPGEAYYDREMFVTINTYVEGDESLWEELKKEVLEGEVE